MLAFSRASELAIRAAAYLALQPAGKVSPVREIARSTGLPRPYLAKVIRPLIRARLVRAFRGPGGGIELGRSAETISLQALVRAVEGSGGANRCSLGLGVCSPENPCPLHPQWTMLSGQLERLLEETTLGSVARGLQTRNRFGAGQGHKQRKGRDSHD